MINDKINFKDLKEKEKKEYFDMCDNLGLDYKLEQLITNDKSFLKFLNE